MVFAVDASREVDPKTLEKMQEYVKAALKLYSISSSNTHVGLLTYGGEHVNVTLPVSAGTQTSTAEQALNYLRLVGGPRKMNKAVRFANSEIFSVKGGSRPNVNRVLVLLTAGKNNAEGKNDLPKAAKVLKERNIDVIVIGVGNSVDDEELTQVATNPDNYVKITDATQLPDALGPLEKSSAIKTGNALLLENSYAGHFKDKRQLYC